MSRLKQTDLRFSPDDIQEKLMDAAIFRQLGVEGGGEDATVADEHRVAIAVGERLDARSKPCDPRRANEYHLYGAAGECGLGAEDHRVVLAAVGVAFHCDIQRGKASLRRVLHLFGEQNTAGARAEHGLGVNERVEHLVKAGALQMLEESSGLAARNDKGVEVLQVFGLADEARGRAKFGKSLGVDLKGALKGEDTDLW